VVTTRAGAYKPRTSPYDFQGHGKECLPYLFELAGKYGIRVVSMEVHFIEDCRISRDAYLARRKAAAELLPQRRGTWAPA
jgi:3-deoxy-7-phosphoheptulonate synthase